MAKSLQDQLLAAGALKKDQAARLKKAKHKQARQQLRGAAQPDAIKQAAEQAQAAKLERDRALSRQQNEARERRAIAAQVQQLIETNRLNTEVGELSYNFSVDGVIKTAYLSATHRDAVIDGRLALTRLDDQFVVVARPVAEKIRQRDASAVLVLNDNSGADADADDSYADYQIPDDLSW